MELKLSSDLLSEELLAFHSDNGDDVDELFMSVYKEWVP